MKFTEFEYKRPEIENFKSAFQSALTRFKEANSFEEQSEIFEAIEKLRGEFDSMYNICYIRHSVDTKNEFYEAENTFFDQNLPSFQDLNTQFHRALIESKFRKQLEEKWGKQLFTIAELSLNTFKPQILEDLQEENKLTSQYIKLKASAEIEFRGEKYNLSGLDPFIMSEDRATRKEAATTKWQFFADNAESFASIFDKMVKVRHKMAQALGYKNFVELGYNRMLRSDYNADMVAVFRKQVQDYIVPIATELRQRQTKRLGVDSLKYYDEVFKFKTGNPKPKGSPEWIVENARDMYKQLSTETNDFFEFMLEKGLMDLTNKDGKATGGYCTYINKYKSPFIFSNFNGTSGDIDVLTHEAGHAFQVFSSRDLGIQEYNWPTYEACEIHSMSMEFFTWPWMDKFFKEDTEKYKFSHLAESLIFIPYGVAVDEFQHVVYENPDMTPTERNAAWRAIEQKYLPYRDYEDNDFLNSGGFWNRQSHIFVNPFYYIDYTLAQICAFQFWMKDRQDHEGAWKDYLHLCQVGGSLSFLELVKLANLRSPFDPECVASVIGEIKKWLDGVDDSKF